MKVLVTGWAGFIGSNFIRYALKETDWEMIGLDIHTYAARPDWVFERPVLPFSKRFRFMGPKLDIRSRHDCEALVRVEQPDAIVHFAAESHVCRSITGPKDFVDTNIVGTWNLLEAVRTSSPKTLFHHVSTDEVYGELGDEGYFRETTPYAPRSPYAASKAASDHLVMAYHHTYGLNTRISNCSNNFGPNQHEEKLIPKAIVNALNGRVMTVYGPGTQIRDWIWVEDHCRGILAAIQNGVPGGQYLFGGTTERTNLEVISDVWQAVNSVLIERGAKADDLPKTYPIEYTNDRPTDDRRYAVDPSHAKNMLNWKPCPGLYFSRLKETVEWYLSRAR